MAAKPRVARANVACTICGQTIAKGTNFYWHNFPAEKAAGRSGMAHGDCMTQGANATSAGAEQVPLPMDSVPGLDAIQKQVDLVEAALDALQQSVSHQVDSITIQEHADRIDKLEALAKFYEQGAKTTIEVKAPNQPTPITIETAHPKLPEVLTTVQTLRQCYLYGPAGAGKTTMAKQVAQALSLPFYYVQLGKSPVSLLTGYPTANGGIVETDFRRAYVNGGVVLLDELDDTLPQTAIMLNGALENGRCGFPDGQKDRHEDCIVIGAGNTAMTGADEDYSARSVQDAAFRERFAYIRIDLDEALERKLTLAQGATEAENWLDHVRAVREALRDVAPHVLVTPRASIRGAQILASAPDTTFAWLTEALILKGGAPEGSDIRRHLEDAGLL